MKFFILASFAPSLKLFRGQLLLDLRSKGHDVVVCAPEISSYVDLVEWLDSINVQYNDAPFSRAGQNPFDDLNALSHLVKIMKRLQPDVFIGYTIKPVVWGGIAARIAKVSTRVALITGLGYAFTGEAQGRRRIIQCLARVLYRISLKGMNHVFFQNPDDKRDFKNYGLLSKSTNVHIINGSGVDTDYFNEADFPPNPIKFLLIARLLGDKGIREYITAGRSLRSKFPGVELHLVGGLDPNPDGLNQSEVNAWVNKNEVIWHGSQDDVRPFIQNCHVYVLPSYREGTPRSVLEAMSMGRPIITTDAPGCRETVSPSINGYLVEVGDAKSLCKAMGHFFKNPELIKNMGNASRRIAKEKYDVHKVNQIMLSKILSESK